ncbi:MAG: DNA-3-methyladenine glycosylase 2 family protein, partial [Oscillospiraceae bacterium]|nr:DNA-3-methyladenine glycosylase 2 family protein [Oscillospiraceae bacterium]
LFEKVRREVGEILPENLTSAEGLFGCGLSRTKAECLAACAVKFQSGELSAGKLSGMSDEEVIKTLTAIRGIGAWTAEMTLIFCLGRADVLSLADYGIRKGLSVLHGIEINGMKNLAEMRKFKALYSPFGTAASVYLWEIAKEAKK